MKREVLSVPGQPGYEQAYQQAYKLAAEQLDSLNNIKEQCHKSGARYHEAGSHQIITLDYLNQPYQIVLPDVEVRPTEGEEMPGIKERILILHYFNQARGTPLSNKVITYKELPEGAIYFPTFAKRAIKPIVDNFGQKPEQLLDIATRLSGQKADYGDVAVTINAFPHVPITFVLWRGDEEFASEGSILFDRTIPDYLGTEDINILCETISWKLVRHLKTQSTD